MSNDWQIYEAWEEYCTNCRLIKGFNPKDLFNCDEIYNEWLADLTNKNNKGEKL